MASKVYDFENLKIFENEFVFVVNKPPYLPSLDERHGEGTSLLKIVRQHHPQAILCHRLDRETSGALVIAKNEEVYKFVTMEFEKRRVLKKYHAVVNGVHQFENLEVDLPIGAGKAGQMRIDFSEGKPSLTFFKSIVYFKHFTLVECIPITGRTHQIRIHLATQKAAITADELYGGKPPYLSQIKRKFNLAAFEDEKPIIKRFALHANSISLHVAPEIRIDVTAPYPKDFAVLLKQLEKFDHP